MAANRRRVGFTLVEIMIVVVIMALLAATIIPQFASSTTDAKTSSLSFNLHTLRSQIDLYKLNHNGTSPTVTSGALPQLTSYTDASGDAQSSPDGTHIYGPYLTGKLPANSLDNKNNVVTTNTWPGTATTAGGWLYHPATGSIAPNTAGHEND